MICPLCKKEFPHGTVFCSRCHTTLLQDLAEADEAVEKAYPGSALVHLWAGENPVIHAALLEQLEKAGIAFYEQPLGTGPSARPVEELRHHTLSQPRFGFEVGVLSSNLAAAAEILERLLKEKPVDLELSVDESQAPGEAKPKSRRASVPSCEVWSGEDESLGGFLAQALKENRIAVSVLEHGETTSICVPPEEESEAREIIHEIVEGQPPE